MRYTLPIGLLGAMLLTSVGIWTYSFAWNPPGVVVPAVAKPAKTDESDAFFTRGEIPQLKVLVEPAELEKLRNDPRHYVRGQIIENDGTTFKAVGIKLKGAAGSFRGVDDRPALTINVDKYTKGQKFHGLEKFHLNNSVQDESCLQEWLCTEFAREIGLPATRVTHARVWLNDRDLGFYVLKEGFDKKFLARHFENSDGNLYDGGFVQDIDAALEKDSGDGADDRSDLQKLVEACQEGDVNKRQEMLTEILNVDAFLKFTAFELLTCHWDGYCRNRNNYRIYFDPSDGRAVFLPHGMDQMFGGTGDGIFDVHGAMVCQAVLTVPDFQARYDKELRSQVNRFVPVEPWLKRIDEVQKRIEPVIAAIDPDQARHQNEVAQGFRQQLTERGKNLLEQLGHRPVPIVFDENGTLLVPDWAPQAETADARLSEEKSPDGRAALLVAAGPGGRCVASWRARVMLAAGTYRFTAQVKTAGVQPLGDDKGIGAGVRISGSNRENTASGNSEWKELAHDFEIATNPGEAILVAELRSTAGQAWFEKSSLKLVKINPATP